MGQSTSRIDPERRGPAMHVIFSLRKSFALVLTISCLLPASHSTASDSATTDQLERAVAASKLKRGEIMFWRSDRLRLLFGYDERWGQAPSSQASSEVVINWKARATGRLMATCYVEATSSSELASLSPSELEQRASSIAQALIRNSQARDPEARLITWRSAKQDNHPVVYSERDTSVETINGKLSLRHYSITTAWKGAEINFECASNIPRAMPEASEIVEFPIRSVLGSLQFLRSN